jgi:hypothetical protein
VSGKLTSQGGALGGVVLRPRRCRARASGGQRNVTLSGAAGSIELERRAGKPWQLTVVGARCAESCRRVSVDRRRCKRFEAEVRSSIFTRGGVRLMEGTVGLDCLVGDGVEGRLFGELSFDNCGP